MVTVDTVVTGNRIRDKRNGLSIPPELSLQTVLQVATRPGYWYRLLSGPALDYANFAGMPPTTIMGTGELFDPSITWDDIADLRSRWNGKLVIKGPLGRLTRAAPSTSARTGSSCPTTAAASWTAPWPPSDLIAPVRDAVGPSVSLLVDSGVRHGADVVTALALGADAAVLGRAYVYGLMAGGEAGVDRAVALIGEQFKRTLQLLGVSSVAELRKGGRELLARA